MSKPTDFSNPTDSVVVPTLTGEVARIISQKTGTRILPYRLNNLILDGRLSPAPIRDSMGRFLWSQSDIARAIEALKIDRRYRQHRTVGGSHATV